MKIGVRLESMGLPLRRALAEAARMGVAGIQVDAMGDLAPGALTQTGRKELLHLFRSHNLELTALGCPLRFGLDQVENQEARIDHIRSVMDLSFDLGPRRVILQAGRIPEEENDPRGAPMTESMRVLGRHGDRVGVVLALETGLEPGSVMARMLNRFDTGSLGINFDPANLLMNGFDLYESLEALSGKIVHSHAHDARSAGPSRAAQEVPVGHGDIDWLRYLSELEQHGYHGWIVVEQESGDRRLENIAEGVQFLKRLGVGAS